ncbi:KOW domain-containing RNA-binding protein [Calorimonas adulescens]|uniref:RNA-binding protein n=1 Tax=Calorimonas adulescens TaxID=2606906 RepID=A0A5D8QE07_9THEO|nr:KOW domain-containing RNA-binding protein [Calorimonas adulescens]TZE82741.1 RNA-binding protein [Calorimonas adulescens]
MDGIGLKVGQVVKSKAGRDKGKLFIVLNVEDPYAYIADGSLRKVEKPKKKKIKHLIKYNVVDENIRTKILNGKKPTNTELCKSLLNINLNDVCEE